MSDAKHNRGFIPLTFFILIVLSVFSMGVIAGDISVEINGEPAGTSGTLISDPPIDPPAIDPITDLISNDIKDDLGNSFKYVSSLGDVLFSQ